MMRSYVYAVDPSVDMARCEDDERMWLPRVMIGDVRFFNFQRLVQLVMKTADSNSDLLTRVYHSRGAGPYIDAIDVQFREEMAAVSEEETESVARMWHSRCDWGHYGHWVAPWEALVDLIVRQVRMIAIFAKEHGFKLYYSQDTRHEW